MILQMKNICKDYLQGKDTVNILKSISLDIEEGDYIAIMGPSGSGKTTLMNIMGFLDVPTSGTYILDGEDLKGASENKLAEVRNKSIGFVFQSFYLLPKLNAVDNVALPLLYRGMSKKERTEKAISALKMVGLGERLYFKPNQMSGGQCQRVAIARAIVGGPKLLLADEPTGALDSVSGQQVLDIFKQLNEMGVTIVMITHEQAVADCANKIYHILDGEILNSSKKTIDENKDESVASKTENNKDDYKFYMTYPGFDTNGKELDKDYE
jgi:putative ABC transport system ATP-binding protein